MTYCTTMENLSFISPRSLSFSHREKAIQCLLKDRARARYGAIYPTKDKAALDDCFSIWNNKMVFWFNDPKGSTHVEQAELFD